jgi:hypothetical protein
VSGEVSAPRAVLLAAHVSMSLADGERGVSDRYPLAVARALEQDDLSPSELVLAWNERHCPPLLETFVTTCQRVVNDTRDSTTIR